MKRKNVYLTKQQIERLNQLADATDITVSRHIRKAIDEYLGISAPIIDPRYTPGYKAKVHYVPRNVFLGPDAGLSLSTASKPLPPKA